MTMAGLRNVCLSVLVCLGILPNAAFSAQKFWEQPPRVSKIDRGNTLALAKGGVPQCEVVVENDAAPVKGVCDGIGPDGALLVAGIPVYAGEAHVMV